MGAADACSVWEGTGRGRAGAGVRTHQLMSLVRAWRMVEERSVLLQVTSGDLKR